MKKYYSLFITCLVAVVIESASGQTILSMTVDPSNPTTTDTIKIYIYNQFNSGGCEGVVYPAIQTGDTFTSTSLHCLGMATVICYDYDTVVITPQLAGKYTFIHMLYFGAGLPSCSPALVASDTASVSFTVSESTGMNEILHSDDISIYPNPLSSTSTFHLTTKLKDAEVIIYDMLGKEMMRKKISGYRMQIERGSLESGVYIVKVTNDESQWVKKIIVE